MWYVVSLFLIWKCRFLHTGSLDFVHVGGEERGKKGCTWTENHLSKMFNSHWQFLPETHTFKNYKTVRNTDTLLRSSRFLLLDPREHTSRVLQVCFDQALISYSRWENGGPKMFIQHDAPGQWLVSMWQSQNFKGQNFTEFAVKSFPVKNETPNPNNWLWSKDCCFLNIIR